MYHDFSRWTYPADMKAAGWPTDSATRWSTRSGRSEPNAHARRRPPVMAHHVGALDALGVEDGDDVPRQERDGVRLDLGGLVRGAVAPQVGDDGGEPGVDEGRHLVAPQAPAVGEPVQEHDRRPLPRDLVLDAHTVHVDAHYASLSPWPRGAQPASGRHDGQQLAAAGPELRCVAPTGAQGEHLLEQCCVGEDLVGRSYAATWMDEQRPGGSRGPDRPRTASLDDVPVVALGPIRLASDLGVDLRQAVTVEAERGAVPRLDGDIGGRLPTPR